MNTKRSRIIGTTKEAIAKAEADLERILPNSFKAWLLENNGLGLEGVSIFPVFDERDPRKTWDSIVRHYRESWAGWLANFEEEKKDFSHLLPFADYGTGDFYCFDYSSKKSDEECRIVRWSHETGDIEHRAGSFTEFRERVLAGDFDAD